jgi:hypothetical protein
LAGFSLSELSTLSLSDDPDVEDEDEDEYEVVFLVIFSALEFLLFFNISFT